LEISAIQILGSGCTRQRETHSARESDGRHRGRAKSHGVTPFAMDADYGPRKLPAG
jgi:hypothetical protein